MNSSLTHFKQVFNVTMGTFYALNICILIIIALTGSDVTKIDITPALIHLDNAFKIVHNQPITMDELIMSIKHTAIQSKQIKQDVYKIYNHVYGPIEEMNGMDIGGLHIEFDHSTEHIAICKYKNGKRYVQILIQCPLQFAYIKWVERIPNELSGTQLMTFIDILLPRLNIKQASLEDYASIKYIGCNDIKERIQLIDLYAIKGETKSWYDKFGYINRGDQWLITAIMREIYDQILPQSITQ